MNDGGCGDLGFGGSAMTTLVNVIRTQMLEVNGKFVSYDGTRLQEKDILLESERPLCTSLHRHHEKRDGVSSQSEEHGHSSIPVCDCRRREVPLVNES